MLTKIKLYNWNTSKTGKKIVRFLDFLAKRIGQRAIIKRSVHTKFEGNQTKNATAEYEGTPNFVIPL